MSNLKDQLLEGGTPGNNQMMQDLQGRISEAHKRMSNAVPANDMNRLNINLNLSKYKEQLPDEGCLRRTFTPKRIFYGYGLLDTVIFFTFLIYTIKEKKRDFAFIFMIIFYLPNFLMLLWVYFADGISARLNYQRWLQFKLIIQAFSLPIYALYFNEYYWEAKICHKYLKSVDMTQAEMQAVIDDQDFTLLTGTGEINKQSSLNV